MKIENKKVQNSLKAETKTELQLSAERRTAIKDKIGKIAWGHYV